jgi:hypothetical protein
LGSGKDFAASYAAPWVAGYTVFVFAQKLRVDVVIVADRRPCLLDWLDNFCMRNFTGQAEVDHTLPVADGLLEAGLASIRNAWRKQ